MKKLVLAAALLSPSAALADFIGVHAGISQWKSEFSGEIAGLKKYNERSEYGWGVPSFEERGFKEEGQRFGYIAFEHPIPLLPNLRLDFTQIDDSGLTESPVLSRRFIQVEYLTINGEPNVRTEIPWDFGQHVATSISIDAYDATAYYEILDNWVNLDLGITIRKMDGEFTETALPVATPKVTIGGTCNYTNVIERPDGLCAVGSISETTPFSIIVPMLYTNVRFDIPMTGVFFEGRGKGIAASGSRVLDIEIEAGYMFDLTVAELGIALGYRTSSLKADDLDDLYADAKLDGYYAGLKFHF